MPLTSSLHSNNSGGNQNFAAHPTSRRVLRLITVKKIKKQKQHLYKHMTHGTKTAAAG
ncbi:hypothetical protein, unlikely [Trypanosoma brucei gambiense DAL972]|uniref:Uncharacterized protein n=1 Tax=Trypanosoma brucei gambiense (strain MHOM/CI/86/DAL972) TaxID=679716 RepID=C9ZRM6_TRYB9|nr:hypothetical protein, unlikely [Trypanosoma brucei gambiense DAL972]CBH12328.1 hypothetical protein, unlikely [Trypanosoma brucei gambiense DAL972]|eukprot:XP_011774609.1 hypothetical protein, unlikely [Trypanosoma brucei gambiense DAL972]